MLLEAGRCALIVVDVQDRLAPAITEIDRVVANVGVLMRAARELAVPILVTEQYPKGLGHTLPALSELAPDADVIEKVEFSAAGNPDFAARLAATGRPDPVICGIEAHVCVLQTALDLRRRGLVATVVADATQSRAAANADAAMARLTRANVTLATTEMVLFEWLRRADHPSFRSLSRLIR